MFNVVKNDLTQVERRYLYPTDGTMVSGTALIQKSLNLNNSCTCMATAARYYSTLSRCHIGRRRSHTRWVTRASSPTLYRAALPQLILTELSITTATTTLSTTKSLRNTAKLHLIYLTSNLSAVPCLFTACCCGCPVRRTNSIFASFYIP